MPLVAAVTDALAHNVSEGQRRILETGSHLEYAQIGALHMLTGYDHLLFLFGVMFFLTRFRDIVTFITAFTLGHSVTLIGATLAGWQANAYLVDAVIAVSVIYKGFDNLDGFKRAIGVRAPNLLGMVFAFGLVHGLGLSTRVQSLPLPESGLVTRLLAFNVGVELGQIVALIAMAWLLALVREDIKDIGPFTRLANGGLMIAGSLLLIFQLHGYLHTSNPDAFGFSRGEHLHHHDDVERFGQGVRDLLNPPSRIP
jgi:HupE / UreJ protein